MANLDAGATRARFSFYATIAPIMRVLLLSDIHANIVALETILACAPAYDTIWCLGDVVGYGPAPNECIERLRGLNAVTLMGNHDRAVLGDLPLDQFRGTARTALEWTMRTLSASSRAWLASLSPKQILSEFDLTLVHASPRDPIWEYVENEEVALANFPFFTTSFCFFGHTHRPITYRLREAERMLRVEYLPEKKPYLLQPKLLLNPGSAGQPRDGDPRAAFAILDTSTLLLTHHRLEYDVATVQRAMLNLSFPPRLISRLAHGA